MNCFVTRQGNHCYYANIANMLNYYGEDVSEAELVLLSNALNCIVNFDDNLFLSIPGGNTLGLEKLNYQVKQIENNFSSYKSLLENNTPILLMINTSILTYNNIYNEANQYHCIVLLNEKDGMLEISDSYMRTIPISLFQGSVEEIQFKNQIELRKASGMYIEKQKNNENQYSIMDILFDFIEMNASCSYGSIIYNLNIYYKRAIEQINILVNKESLNDLAFGIKVGGVVARYDYMIELFNKYLHQYSIDVEILTILKSKWDLVANKLMKCSITLNREYYAKIFAEEIPILINSELCFYQKADRKLKSFPR